MFHAHLVLRGHFTHRSVPITVQFRGIVAGRLCYAEHTSGLLATPDVSVAAETFICHPDRGTRANKTGAVGGVRGRSLSRRGAFSMIHAFRWGQSRRNHAG